MLLKDVHIGFPTPNGCSAVVYISGSYEYYHYGLTGDSDVGWGCGYRTLQTIISWFKINFPKHSNTSVPSLREIQQILAKTGDKEKDFIDSKNWIGSFEVFLVLDTLFQVSCQLLHIEKGSQLRDHINQITDHFSKFGSPIMMGGLVDTSSKCLIGVASRESKDEHFLLVLDPHFVKDAQEYSSERIQTDGFVKWVSLDEFEQDSFYNICLPKAEISPDNSVKV